MTRFKNSKDIQYCPRCKQYLSPTCFGLNRSSPTGTTAYCKPCLKDYCLNKPRIQRAEKRCSKCKTIKPILEFHLHSRNRDGHSNNCKPCAIQVSRKHKQDNQKELAEKARIYRSLPKNKERQIRTNREWWLRQGEKRRNRIRRYFLKKEYGITLERHDEMFQLQGGLCAICRLPGKKCAKNRSPLDIDHDHSTGAIRGLLCFTCNSALGGFQDDVNLLKRAIDYLNFHKSKQ